MVRAIFQAVIWATRGGAWRRFDGTGLDGKIKRRAVGEGYEVAPTRKHPLLALLPESSTISMLWAPAAHPIAAHSPPLLVLLQYDNYMP